MIMKNNILKKLAVTLSLSLGLLLVMAGCTKDNTGDVVDEEIIGEEIIVSSAEEFLEAITPNAHIVFKKGTYDLSPEIDELFDGDGKKFNKNHEYVKLESCNDGVQIVIKDVDGLTIAGQDGKTIELQVEPRYADVLAFEDCTNITISNMTIGHTIEQGFCSGDVLEFTECSDITLDSLDLYGCGTYGIVATDASTITMTDSTIRDCSSGIMYLTSSDNITFKNCTMTGCEGYTMIGANEVKATFNKCTFNNNSWEDNTYSNGFIELSSENDIKFKACYFGYDEAKAVSFGEIASGYGVSFDDKCEFEMVLDGDGSDIDVDGTEKDVYIDNVEDLLEAIGPKTNIFIEPGYYNISEYIENIDQDEWNDTHEYVKIQNGFDGYYVDIIGVDYLYISSNTYDSKDVELVVEPRYSPILQFEECSFISLYGMTMGHTESLEEDSCAAAVLSCYMTSDIYLYDLDLYGCGMVGLEAYHCGDLYAFDTIMHDCTWIAMDIYDVAGNMYFNNCNFTDTLGIDVPPNDYTITFEQCTFGSYESEDIFNNHFVELIDCNLSAWSGASTSSYGGADDTLTDATAKEYIEKIDTLESYWEAYYVSGSSDMDTLPGYTDNRDDDAYAYIRFTDDGKGYIMQQNVYQVEEKIWFDWSYSDGKDFIIMYNFVDDYDTDLSIEAAYAYFYYNEDKYAYNIKLDFDGEEVYYHKY